jgi:two-component system, OmpR family, phosphate regulon sensor histidine kinase PhoR
MHATEGHIEAIESSGAFGAPRIPTRPITWSMTAKAKPHKPSEFESVLLAIAGHDLRQPLQVIQSTHELLDRGDRATSEFCQQLRSSQSAINRLRNQLDQSVERAKGAEANSGAGRALVRASYFRERSCGSNERGLTSATIESDTLLLSIVPRLFSNVVKYTKPGGRILLGCCHPGHSARMDVELVSPRMRCLECSNFAHE